MSRAEPEPTEIDLDASPFEPVPVSSLPLDKEERRALKAALARIEAARATVAPGEYAYTENSPFGIPPID